MKRVKVSDVATLNASTFSAQSMPEVIQYLDTGNITDGEIQTLQAINTIKGSVPSRAQRKVKKDTIVYSTVRPRLHHYGILQSPNSNMVVSTGFVTIDANPELIDPYYLYCKLTTASNTEYLASLADTAVSSYPSISPSDIGNLEITIPDSVNVQKNATLILKNIDTIIANNNAISSQLESLAKTIYDYWFLQFDFPDEHGRPYKSSGGKMVWNEELKREIPEGWKCEKLKEISELVMNSINPSDNPKTIYIHYSIPAYDDYGYPISECGEEINSGKYIVPNNSILVAKLNPQFKRIWEPLSYDSNSICSTEFMPFIPKKAKNKSFLYSTLNSDIFQSYMIQCSSSSTGSRKRMQPELCGEYKFAYPNSNEMIIEDFCNIANGLQKKKQNIAEENHQLTSLRDFLLPMLMNGQVTFKEQS